MNRLSARSFAVKVAACATWVVLFGAAAQAQCVTKAGQGEGKAEANAEFQAWEAVLQATDWGAWVQWMSTTQKIGTAPGYRVSNLKKTCSAGGSLGRQCVIQATLCK